MTRQRGSGGWFADVGDRVRAPVNRALQTTLKLLESELQPVQRDQVRQIRGAVETILDHVDDLLDYISLEAGQLSLHNIDFDLRVMMDGITRGLALRASDRGVALSSHVHHTVPARLRGDPGRLRQVINSRVGRALRRSRGGAMSIDVQMESESGAGVTLIFSVTGTAADAEPEGGLGAAIADHLVRMMGGRSGEGRGDGLLRSWFTVVLARREVAPAGGRLEQDVAGQRVLLVCDDPTGRAALRDQLEAWGCQVESTPDAPRARERLLGQPPFDVALIDLDITSADLETLAREVKDAVGERTHLVVIRTATQRGDASRMDAAGYSAYLTKSVRPVELHGCLTSLASGGGGGIITRHTLAELRKDTLRLLLVEHNTVNRKLALRILDRLGYRAEAVATSAEALEILGREQRDLVLMAVQLPDRGGIETVRIVRDPGSDVLQHDIPVVGITTRVAAETAERCVAAGMNACLVRPLEPEDLRRTIERELGGAGAPIVGAGGSRTSALYNRRELLERLSGDEQLCRDVLRTFIDGAPPLVEAMYGATRAQDTAALERHARSLMDAAANVSAEGVRSLAHRIGHAAHARDLSQVPRLLTELQVLLEQLQRHVG